MITTLFPFFKNTQLIHEINEQGKPMQIKAGEMLMDIGTYIKFVPLVTKGAIKIMRIDEDGGELFLYFLYPGQTCALSLQCCQANAPSEIKAVAEEDTELIAIPISKVEVWNNTFPEWQQFMMQTYNQRFNELLATIDSVVFEKLDKRLLKYLKKKVELNKKKDSNIILNISHQNIANDLHSSREVISRLLKQFEKKGKLTLGRNKIELM